MNNERLPKVCLSIAPACANSTSHIIAVTPAKAGVQRLSLFNLKLSIATKKAKALDSGLRRNDGRENCGLWGASREGFAFHPATMELRA